MGDRQTRALAPRRTESVVYIGIGTLILIILLVLLLT
jgi:hypothetical protein